LNTQKNPYLNQATKKYLPNIPTQKNTGIKNFKPKKNPSIIPLGMAAKEVKEDKIDVVVKVEIGIQH